ncbi:MAG: hypothetical protein A2Z29_05925 [Chloroflexi bacterium RBG_16_56_11]|nr:MAG: hypothetical protein A2Z29_05925 [Chloroflexi bacterium RBG_16_56_11]
MARKEFGPQPWLFPNPTVLVGTVIDGKPNFATFAGCGIAGDKPPTISIAVHRQRYTLKGIRQNKEFSVVIPSVNLIKEADYCGLVSGVRSDKVRDCGFTVFYGTLKSAPLIEQCPVNLECTLLKRFDVGVHDLVIGKIVQTYVSEECLTDGKPDIMKIKPIVFSMGSVPRYNAVGEYLGQGYHIGKELKK